MILSQGVVERPVLKGFKRSEESLLVPLPARPSGSVPEKVHFTMRLFLELGVGSLSELYER